MSKSVRQIRDLVADQITTALGDDGWTESRTNYDLFPHDSRALSHKSFAVGVPTTASSALDRQNNRGGTKARATVATTTVSVRFAHRLRADHQVGDYADALDAEALLLAAVLALEEQAGMSVRLRGVPLRRGDAGEGTVFLGQLDFEVLHTLPLE